MFPPLIQFYIFVKTGTAYEEKFNRCEHFRAGLKRYALPHIPISYVTQKTDVMELYFLRFLATAY